MFDYNFETTIDDKGFLKCPKEYILKDAKYKVLVTNDNDDILSDLKEVSAVLDSEQDFLSNEEIEYYLALD